MSYILCIILIKLLLPYASKGNEEDELYVLGGRRAYPGQFPYVAYIEAHNERDPKIVNLCTATIIDSKWVITAAHCYSRNNHYRLYVGSVDRTHIKKHYEIDGFIVHEGWKSQNKTDLALVKIREGLIFNDRVKKINLANRKTPTGTRAVALGFGQYSLKHGRYRYLNFINAKVLSHDDCFKLVNHDIINKNELCGLTAPNSGVCFGDSGGPLIANNNIIGVLATLGSLNDQPCGSEFPDIYTDIYEHLDWIKQHMN